MLELSGYQFHEAIVVQIARRRDDDVAGSKSVRVSVDHRIAFEPLYRLFRPQDRLPQWMVLPEVLGKDLMHQVIGVILVHLDLFHDHPALPRNIARVKHGVENQIAQNIQGRRHMLIEHFDVEADAFFGGESVHVSANGVDLPGNLFGRTALGALKNHVLDEMRDPIPLRIFVPRTGLQPYSDRGRADVLHLFRDDGQPIGQFLATNVTRFLNHDCGSCHPTDWVKLQ